MSVWAERLGCAGLTLALCAVAISPARTQSAAGGVAPPREQILAAARTVMERARYATFVTLDATGQPQARVVDPFSMEPDSTVWIATNGRSRKVDQVAANSRVTLLYFDTGSQSYVTLVGTARLVGDPVEKAKRFKEEWAGFYKDRNRGDDYLLLQVTPTRLEILAPKLGLTNDPVTWRPVTLDLR